MDGTNQGKAKNANKKNNGGPPRNNNNRTRDNNKQQRASGGKPAGGGGVDNNNNNKNNNSQQQQQQRGRGGRGGGGRGGRGGARGKKKNAGAKNDDAEANKAACDALREEANRAIEAVQARIRALALEAEEAERKAAEALSRRRQAVDDRRAATLARDEARRLNSDEAVADSRQRHEANKKKLKSDLKRTTAFVKRVKSGMSDDQRASLKNDAENLNLTRYISELVKAVAETRKYKDKDVSVAGLVCSALYRRHSDFAPDLYKELSEVFFDGGVARDQQADEVVDDDLKKRRRASMRLLIELFLDGVYTDETLLVRIMSKIETDAALLVVFLKAAGEDALRIVPRRIRLVVGDDFEQLEYPKDILSPKTRSDLLEKARNSYEALVARLRDDAKSLWDLEKRCTRDALTHGSLSEQKEKVLEDARKAKEKLAANVAALADSLDVDPPDIRDEDNEKDDEDERRDGGGISVYAGAEKVDRAGGVFDDEATRTFYEDYPNVLDVLPVGVLGLADDEVATLKKERQDAKAMWNGATLTDLRIRDTKQTAAVLSSESVDRASATDRSRGEDDDDDDATEENDEEINQIDDLPQLIQTQLTTLLNEELPTCFSRERADAAALKFCDGLGAKKSARKRLVKALHGVPRTALDLLPQYARVAAIVSVAYRDVATGLVDELSRNFRYWLRRKSQYTAEARIRNIRYIAELLMFRIAPPHLAFSCLRVCIEDFQHFNVDVACLLFEIAGGFLLRSPPTRDRATQCLETMMRIRKAKPLNGRESALVDGVYFHLFPPETAAKTIKRRSRKYKYVQFLFFQRLARGHDVEGVIKDLRRLPWNEDDDDDSRKSRKRPDPNRDQPATTEGEEGEEEELVEDEATAPLVAKFFLKLARSKADSASMAADALSGLHKYRPRVTELVLDSLLEEFDVLALETPASSRPVAGSQRLVAYAHFLGELYSFFLVSTHHLFAILFRLLRKGHEVTDAFRAAMAQAAAYDDRDLAKDVDAVIEEGDEEEEEDEEEGGEDDDAKEGDEEDKKYEPPTRRAKFSLLEHATHDPRVPCAADEPRDFLRVTLACVVLRTCGSCIVAVPSQFGILSVYLDELQRYFYCKPVAPLGPRYALLDCIEQLERGARVSAKKRKDGTLPAKGQSIFRVRESWYQAHDAVEAQQTVAVAKGRRRGSQGATKDDDDAGQEDEEDEEVRRGTATSRGEESLHRPGADDDDDEDDAEDEDEEEDDDDDEDDDDEDEDDDEEDDDDDDEDEDDEDDDDEDDDEDEEDEDYDRLEEKKMVVEDPEFDQAFALMMSQSMAAPGPRPTPNRADDMAMTSSIARRLVSQSKSSSHPDITQPQASAAAAASSSEASQGAGLKFQVLRRGAKGKVEARELVVPNDSSLATQVQRNEVAQRREHEDLKANVLRQANRMRSSGM